MGSTPSVEPNVLHEIVQHECITEESVTCLRFAMEKPGVDINRALGGGFTPLDCTMFPDTWKPFEELIPREKMFAVIASHPDVRPFHAEMLSWFINHRAMPYRAIWYIALSPADFETWDTDRKIRGSFEFAVRDRVYWPPDDSRRVLADLILGYFKDPAAARSEARKRLGFPRSDAATPWVLPPV